MIDNEEPSNIGLKPNHVFTIPKGMEKVVFDSNVLYQNTSRSNKSVILSSFKDTINSDFLEYLINLSKKQNIILEVRLALPEEHAVLRYKRAGKYYPVN